MIEQFPLFLALVVIILLLVMLADKIKVAYPVLLVLAGLLISFIPAVPTLYIKPELIFVIFLPPLLYEAAFNISWKELWRWRRIVGSFAFIVVFLTALSVAFVANSFIPGFSLALGFLIGGIVSPPDAVSASAILKFVKLPKRISSILEGESLLNDASSLIIFRFAMVAAATGQFVWHQAALSFIWMVVGGAAIGLLIGWLFMKAHKLLPTDASVDSILTLVTPYVMYIVAEEVHSSGVLAVVCGGLFLSDRIHIFLDSTSRLRGVNVWESLVFMLNGLVFLLIGLDLPQINEGLKQEGIAISSAIGYGLLITATLMVVRFISSYGAVVTTKVMSHFIQVADPNPGLKAPLVLSWTGMRGVVSLAAALSIPEQISEGVPFPHRNLILFITFIVILTTLVLQGLTLPWLIKRIHMPDYGDHHTEEEMGKMIKKGLSEVTLNYLRSKHSAQLQTNVYLQQLVAHWERKGNTELNPEIPAECKKVHIEVLEEQRKWLQNKNKTDNKVDEDMVRNYLYAIDLEEEKLRHT